MYDFDEDIKEEEKSSEPPAWMLTFADLVSLLICFFVLLYSMKSVNENIWQKISGSFAGALNYSQKFKQINPNNDSSVEAESLLSEDSMAYIQSVLETKFEKEDLLQYVNFDKNFETNDLHIAISGKEMFLDESNELTVVGEKILYFITETLQYIEDDMEIASYTGFNPKGLAMQDSILKSLMVKEFIGRKGNKKNIKVIGYGSQLYDSKKDILEKDVLEKETIKVDLILKSK